MRIDGAGRAWAETLLGEIAHRRGDPAAERHFRAALDADPRDLYLLGAYSDWLLDQQRADDVIALVGNETRVDALLLRLALAQRAAGRPEAAATIETLRARFEASRARGDSVHQRENARFELALRDDPQSALALALDNWKVQREPSDLRILAEAAAAAGDAAALDIVRRWLAETGIEYPAVASDRSSPARSAREMKSWLAALAMLLGACRRAGARAQAFGQLPHAERQGRHDRRPVGHRASRSRLRARARRQSGRRDHLGRSEGEARRHRRLRVVATAPRRRQRAVPEQRVTEQLIDDHSDGAYAVLRFIATCAAAPKSLTVDYRLFFDLDPQHRGLCGSNIGERRAPESSPPTSAEQSFTLAQLSKWEQFVDYGNEGVWHIWTGFDHVLFLLSLLLPAVLVRVAARTARAGNRRASFRAAFWSTS